LLSLCLNAQTKESIAVLNIDTKGLQYDATSVGNMVRLELEKTKVYNIMDKYDMNDMTEKNKLDISNCYGKTCLVRTGKILKVDKMLTGSVERFGKKIVIILKIIDVKTSMLEKTDVMEYLNLPQEIQLMIEISVKNLLGIENDPNLVNILVNYEDPIISVKTELNLNGPRMGVAYITGKLNKRLTDPIKKGGYDTYPVMSQFGYQFEKQYLSAGNFQALAEFLIIFSGLEQQMFNPSFNFMNGFRTNKGGWEIAFGPNISLRKTAKGFYDNQGILGKKGEWYRKNEWNNDELGENPYDIVEGIDKRGAIGINSSWVWAIGKTFKSGYLNIPVNVYFSPSKEGSFVGISFGFNVRKKKIISDED